jgi:Tol biopolymer transport system component
VAIAVVAAIAVLGSATGHAATGAGVANGRIFFYRLLVNGGGDLFAVQPSGSGLRRVARNGTEPSVSADGRLVVFQAQVGCGRTACQARDVAVMDADGSHRRAIPGTDGLPNSELPSFSPDGGQIVFDDGARSIWAVNTDGSNLRRLASLKRGVGPSAPVFSRDGKTIVFTEFNSQTGNKLGVFEMDADGTHVRRAPNVAGDATSPDGRTVVFGCGHGLCRMSSNGSRRRQLTHPPLPVPRNTAPVVDGFAGFSPDGTKIVFIRYAGNLGPGRWNGPHGLYVMSANGSRLRKLDGNGNDDGPSWQRLPSP